MGPEQEQYVRIRGVLHDDRDASAFPIQCSSMGAADMAQFLEVWIYILALPTVVPPSRTHILFALLFVSSGQLLRGIVSPAFTSVVIYPHPCGDVEVVREEKHLRTESDTRRAIKAQDRDMRVSTPGGLYRRQIAVFGADRCSRDGLSVFCGSCCGLIVFVT